MPYSLPPIEKFLRDATRPHQGRQLAMSDLAGGYRPRGGDIMPAEWTQQLSQFLRRSGGFGLAPPRPLAPPPAAPAASPQGYRGPLEFPFTPPGFTNDQVGMWADRYAQQRGGYVPHMVMQEGHIEYRGGVPGIYIKYQTPQGSSTEWTPLG